MICLVLMPSLARIRGSRCEAIGAPINALLYVIGTLPFSVPLFAVKLLIVSSTLFEVVLITSTVCLISSMALAIFANDARISSNSGRGSVLVSVRLPTFSLIISTSLSSSIGFCISRRICATASTHLTVFLDGFAFRRSGIVVKSAAASPSRVAGSAWGTRSRISSRNFLL